MKDNQKNKELPFAVENFDHKTLSDQDLFVNNKKLYKYLVHISKYRTFAAAN